MTARQVGTIVPLLLVYAGLWLFLTPYVGLNHDAQGYALQAITASHDGALSRDIFLAYRSQEEFSVFPQVYAVFADMLGLETAAAALTFTFQALWYVAAFLLLRRMLNTKQALFGIGLLLTMPAVYGGLRVFHLAEPFLTGRLPAEVLCLLGLWLWLSQRRILAALALAAAMATHPLIAFPALLLLGMAETARRSNGGMALPLLALAGCVAAIAGAYFLGGDSPTMAGRWLAVTQTRSRFLFLDLWRAWDWNHTLQTLFTVLIGSLALDRSTEAGRLLRTALWLSLAGLALTAFYSLVLQLDVLIQGQPWRWHWPARFLAIGTLPAIIWALWSAGGMQRAAGLFLASSWVFVTPLSSNSAVVTLMGALLAAVSLGLVAASRGASDAAQRTSVRGAWAVLLAVLAASVVTSSLAWFMADSVQLSGESGAAAHVGNVLRLITPAVALAALCAATVLVFWTAARGMAVALVGVALIAVALPSAARAWTEQRWTGAAHAEFADWRALIPAEAEVLWWESLRETWFLLERRAYLTRSQSGGVVFSSDLADEIARRALVLEPLVTPGFWLGVQARTDAKPAPLTLERLAAICRDPELGYVIWNVDLGTGAPSKHWPKADDRIFLYDCGAFRKGASNGAQ